MLKPNTYYCYITGGKLDIGKIVDGIFRSLNYEDIKPSHMENTVFIELQLPQYVLDWVEENLKK